MYNVAYDSPSGSKLYNINSSTKEIAEKSLDQFKALYLKEDGSGKDYPNGKGKYPFSNPRIVKI